MLTRSVMLLCTTLLCVISAFAQLPTPVISVIPAAPTDADVMHITVATGLPCYPVAPTDGPTINAAVHTIQIFTHVTCTALTTPPPPYTFTVNVGPVPPGQYQIQYLSSSGTAPPALAATSAVQVSDAPVPPGAPYSRLEIVSGDRQIAVNTTIPAQPYKVRALDAAGDPVAGLTLFIGPTSYTGKPLLLDEFGFRGFNANGYETWLGPGRAPSEYLFVTDQNGVATGQGPYRFATAPSAFTVAAADISGTTAWYTLPRKFFSAVMTASPPPGQPSVLIEYFHAPTDHYFNTLSQNEIDALERGYFAGWSRSIGSFIAYATEAEAPVGAVPVCRFFSSLYTAHFYTADQAECQAVIDRWPDVWTLESRAAFYIFEPNKATGECAAGLQPVYRLYSTRNGPNHRYVTDPALRDVMVAAGWTAEGFGADAVMLCTPK